MARYKSIYQIHSKLVNHSNVGGYIEETQRGLTIATAASLRALTCILSQPVVLEISSFLSRSVTVLSSDWAISPRSSSLKSMYVLYQLVYQSQALSSNYGMGFEERASTGPRLIRSIG